MKMLSSLIEYEVLDIEMTHFNENIYLEKDELLNLTNLISWKNIPSFPSRGRMAWYIFKKEPVLLDGRNISLKAAKIKGVGGFNPLSCAKNRDPISNHQSDNPFQPTTEPLLSFSSYPHIGFTQDGDFTIVNGATAPIGGILHERAFNEYICAKHLYEKKVLTIVPLMVAKYDKRFVFNEKRMGVVVCVSPSKFPLRLSEIQNGSFENNGGELLKEKYYLELLEKNNINGDPYTEQTRLKLLCSIAYKVGVIINKFSESGLYRYSAELSNFEYDFTVNDVVLTDLDSSLFLKDLKSELQRLQVLRDMASMIYHFVAKFANPLSLGKYTIKNLLEINPLKYIIKGYFNDISDEKAEESARVFWNYFIPHFMLLNKYQEQIKSNWSTERRRSYKMDHELFYVLAIHNLYSTFCNSNLGRLYTDVSLTQDLLIKKIEIFLGTRFQYFEYLNNNQIYNITKNDKL